MRHTIKAFLFSALVFPGTGHFALQKYARGGVLLGITFVCLYYLISVTIGLSKTLHGKIQSGEMSYDKAEITAIVTEKVSGGDYQHLGLASMGLLFCWVYGVIDSIRLGRIKDRDEEKQPKSGGVPF